MQLIADRVNHRKSDGPYYPPLCTRAGEFGAERAHEQDGKDEVFAPVTELTQEQANIFDVGFGKAGK